MPVVQPVLGTVTNPYIYIYMIIVGKSMPIDNYEQYKRVINQITGRLYMYIYIYIYTHTHTLETKKKKMIVCVCVCVVIYNKLLLCFEAGK